MDDQTPETTDQRDETEKPAPRHDEAAERLREAFDRDNVPERFEEL